MLTLEQQVVSLELAKKMKELGFPHNSHFWYWEDTHGSKMYRGLHDSEPYNLEGGWTTYSAYTVGELGEFLKIIGPKLTIKAYGELNGFSGTGAIGSLGMIRLLTEPNRPSEMLIYLAEKGLLDTKTLG